MNKSPVAVIQRAVAPWTLAIGLGWIAGCLAEPSTPAHADEVVASTQELKSFCRHRPSHPRCRTQCGNGVVDPGEACDDGNRDAGDGCSATCELDDNLATPGDDRPGYVICKGVTGPESTCSPGQGCCLNGTDADPDTAVCAAAMSDCEVSPAFETCDGHEDCTNGERCRGTRFGNSCGQGYYDVCHTAADCDEVRPYCNDGICEGVPPEETP